MQVLPVDAFVPNILASLHKHPNLVVRAEPGAGKTTRVPPALLGVLAAGKEVVVLEPRRLAARMAAQRVAEEGGHKLGGLVGYQVRFEDVTSASTRIRFVTEQILVRQLLTDSRVDRLGAVVLDEFHERHIHGDLALALLKKVQRESRPDLKIIVMSATLDAAPVARFLDDCPMMDIPGRVFPVTVEFADKPEPVQGGRHLDRQVADAVRSLAAAGMDGDVLVFLPGAAEIRRAREACEGVAQQHNLLLCALHADLAPEEQDLAIKKASRHKVILSTNVAESSLTIDGVTTVIDSGLARIPSHAAWSGLPVLKIGKVSRASATQRAGRAGRTKAGRCIRLYTRHDHDSRPDHTPPEIKRLDLAETVLLLHGLGVKDPATFPFYEAPEPASLTAAENLLKLLQALEPQGTLTQAGRAMLRFPLHPRQARVILEANARGFGTDGCMVAAILGERDIQPREGGKSAHHSDVLLAVDAVESCLAGGSVARQAASLGLDVGAVMRVDRTRKQLKSALASLGLPTVKATADEDAVLRMAILAGYPDRVAMKRKGKAEFLLPSGGTATLAPWSRVTHSELLVALDVEERTGGRDDGVKILRASEIEMDWLLDVVPHALRDEVAVTWNSQAERVEASSRFMLRDLVLEEKELHKLDVPEVAALLARQAVNAGVVQFCDVEELTRLRARIAVLKQAMPDAGFPALGDDDVKKELAALCVGLKSFKELRQAGLVQAIANTLTHEQTQLLAREAPESISLPGGKRCQVHYVVGQPPWVESRLQDFFGMRTTPRIMGGRMQLNVHLLAPNLRAVQITNDLAGFWERTYPGVRKELMRKYPRHLWPEDGQDAAPPPPGRRR